MDKNVGHLLDTLDLANSRILQGLLIYKPQQGHFGKILRSNAGPISNQNIHSYELAGYLNPHIFVFSDPIMRLRS